MKRTYGLLILATLFCGCGSAKDQAAGITAFIEACKVPVSSELTMNSMTGNTITFSCAEFKPIAEKAKP